MSYYINMFFSTQLTCIPRMIDKYFGQYYSNSVGNALTWVFAMWLILHYLFDSYLNILLRKMQYKLFLRIRMLNALWYCGFFGTAFLYCLGTIVYRTNLVTTGGSIPLHISMGLGLTGTFFFQSFIWTSIKFGYEHNCLSLLALSLLPITTLYSRQTELFIYLLALVSLVKFINNLMRCLVCILDKNCPQVCWLLIGTMGLFICIHIIIIPVFLIAPLAFNLSSSVTILCINLILWWVAEVMASPLYKYIKHWIKHANIKDPRKCADNVVECCLFPIRDDFSFNMWLLKLEISERNKKSIARRKPKDRNVFVQTLKCMVAIRRKLKKKRGPEAECESESESDNEKDQEDESESDHDKKEDDESSEEESPDEDDEDEDPEKREYQEETAKALQEDREELTVESATNTESEEVQTADDTNKKND